ncbi:glucan 1,4-beta-glucosidase [Shewanella sairae]|uniref:Glucan 1,4-beta-glucosidase n=1 Tax=Shewanella sairae TaxID=190310 RepID=A0ABQ4PQJ5_9GAMM|nr:glucan 1,4-beta-glucosidase [Shewanella sairae]
MLTAFLSKLSISSYTAKRLLLISLMVIFGCSTTSKPADSSEEINAVWPQLSMDMKPSDDIEQQVAELIAEMTLAQKVAQMIQPEIGSFTLDDMREYGFGSYLNGGGSFPNKDKYAAVSDWVSFADAMYQASIDDSLDGAIIPTMWGTDAVHGHNNVIGATLFPHNIGLGAAHNPSLIEQIAQVTAKEVSATGIDWVFAPTVAVARDDRWGRTYESYSENPDVVKSYAASIVSGLQGQVGSHFLTEDHVIATTKHFIGDGGTTMGIDQGDTDVAEQLLFDIHGQGYVAGLSAGAQTVMASFNSWQGKKVHGSYYLLTQVLKQRLGFDGFVVGDWNGHGQIPGCSIESCPEAVNAGLDVYMVPTAAWKPLFNNLIEQVENGDIPIARINDAVSRILRVKLRAGLFTKPSPAMRTNAGKSDVIGSASHRELAKQAVRESLVLLKNNNNLLPLSANQIVMVAGDGANNISKQTGGWTLSWQGTGNQNSDFPGATSIFSGIKTQVNQAGGKAFFSENGRYAIKPDVAVVVFGEEPYAEGYGDLDNLEYQRGNKRDLSLLKRLKAAGIPAVSVFISGRPLWVNAELNASDAFVASWLPGSEGAGIAEVLFRDSNNQLQYDFSGKLSFSWPSGPEQVNLNYQDANYQPLFPYGFGLSYADMVNLPQLGEVAAKMPSEAHILAIYDSGVQKTWKISTSGKAALVSNLQLDRFEANLVRSETLQLSFKDKTKGEVSLNSAFPRDLTDFAEQASMLSMLVNIVTPPNRQVQLTMKSNKAGKKHLDISKQLKQMYGQGWQILNVELS